MSTVERGVLLTVHSRCAAPPPSLPLPRREVLDGMYECILCACCSTRSATVFECITPPTLSRMKDPLFDNRRRAHYSNLSNPSARV